MPVYTKRAGAWAEGDALSFRVGGAWKSAAGGWMKVAGEWHRVWPRNVWTIWHHYRTTTTYGDWTATRTTRTRTGLATERQWQRSVTVTIVRRRASLNTSDEEFTSADTVTTETEWRFDTPEVWSSWTETGSGVEVVADWTATGTYRGSCAAREQSYTRRVRTVLVEEQTSNHGRTHERTTYGVPTTETEWRSDVEPDVWPARWTERSRSIEGLTAWTGTTTYQGSGGTFERLWTRSARVVVVEERTSQCGAVETRTLYGQPTAQSEWRSAVDAWGPWTRKSASIEGVTAWAAVAGSYRGTGADREQLWTRSARTVVVEERTSLSGRTEERTLYGQPTTQSEYRPAPEVETWGPWKQVSTEIEGVTDWVASNSYRGSGASRVRLWTRTARVVVTQERTSSIGRTERRRVPQSPYRQTDWRPAPTPVTPTTPTTSETPTPPDTVEPPVVSPTPPAVEPPVVSPTPPAVEPPVVSPTPPAVEPPVVSPTPPAVEPVDPSPTPPSEGG